MIQELTKVARDLIAAYVDGAAERADQLTIGVRHPDELDDLAHATAVYASELALLLARARGVDVDR